MNKVVIFDLDGTIFDTIEDIHYYANLAMNKFGYKERSLTEVSSFVGNGARKLITRCVGEQINEQEIDKILDFFVTEYTKEPCVKTKIYDGIFEVITQLKKRGYKIAILSNKQHATTERAVSRFFKNNEIDIVLGQTQDFKLKPDKQSTIYILNQLDVLPENAYMVGDGETDYLTAVNAGIKGISVLWGNRTREFLATFGAKTFANNPLELLDLIK